MAWQLQEAKQRFSELVRRAVGEGPQVVTRHGEEVVIVIAADEFHRMAGDVPSFKEFLVGPPHVEDRVKARPHNGPVVRARTIRRAMIDMAVRRQRPGHGSLLSKLEQSVFAEDWWRTVEA